MKLTIPTQVSPYLEQLRDRWHKVPETPAVVMLPLHEDLGGLTETEIKEEMNVIDRRIELNVLKPEGIDGLNYRKSRLEAQLKALAKRK